MKILLTNDDGINAKGINALFDLLSAVHDVYMIAPASERSACSNAITMRDSLILKKHDSRHFSVTGYPADCTNIGIHGVVTPEPDIVISGINHGPNMGDDVHYSGTVAGARTAFVNGRSAIAVSYCTKDNLDAIADAAQCVVGILESGELIKDAPVFLNINYPAIPQNEVKGIAFTFLDKRKYVDHYKVLDDKNGEQEIRLEGYVKSERRPGSDSELVSRGFVSVTPLALDATDYQLLEKLNKGKEMVS
jgi:5'-nucleotidase